METKEIVNLLDLPMADAVRGKIIRQANFAGVDQNLNTGDTIILQVGDQVCRFTFDREQALGHNAAPDCAAASQTKMEHRFATRDELTTLLGLTYLVSDAVYEKAVHDKTFFHNLISSRGTPFLDVYLSRADQPSAGRPAVDTDTVRKDNKPGNILLGFAKSMIRWGKSGFAKVDEETYNRRLKACAGCSFLTDVPDKFLYKLLDSNSSSGVCSSCGCIVSKKALLATDTCPERNPEQPALNRWNESPIR